MECSQTRAGGVKCRQFSWVTECARRVSCRDCLTGGRTRLLLVMANWNKQEAFDLQRLVMKIIYRPWSFSFESPMPVWNFWTCQSSPFITVLKTLELLRQRFVDFTFLPFDDTPSPLHTEFSRWKSGTNANRINTWGLW